MPGYELASPVRRIDPDVPGDQTPEATPAPNSGQGADRAGLAGRKILFLQGMPGPFFRDLARAILDLGGEVRRIHFNAGDWFDWRMPDAQAFRGDLGDWPRFLARFLDHEERASPVTDIVLFGDQRPLHRVAIAIAAARNIPVFIVEEGYLRPNFAAFSPGGIHAPGAVPTNLTDLRLAGAKIDASLLPLAVPVESDFHRRGWETFFYYVATYFGAWLFPRYQTHRTASPIHEGLLWLRRFARARRLRAEAARVLESLEARPFFLFPLQLDNDFQIRIHSDFGDMANAIREVMGSFARSAPAAMHLVIKLHPLDPGLRDWARFVRLEADRLGIGPRCAFLNGGDIEDLVCRAEGVVTVNSTVGALALAADTPLLVLGRAFYRIEGIVSGQTPDQFWGAPQGGDPGNFALLRRVMIDRHLVNGGFHSARGLRMLVEGAVRRLRESSPRSAR